MRGFEGRALLLIYDRHVITAGDFADTLWPESEGHRRMANAGQHGSRRGHGMLLAAGSYLGKLRRKGYVDRRYEHGAVTYRLTQDGIKRANEYASAIAKQLERPTRRGFLGLRA